MESDAGASVGFSPWSAILFLVRFQATMRFKFRCFLKKCFYQQPTAFLDIRGEHINSK